MKTSNEFGETLLNNTEHFKDPFFQRFHLRHGPRPLQLNERIAKNYLFPTFYADVTCAIGIFHCDYKKAQSLLPSPLMQPVRMTKGRSLVIFSCYEYRNVMNIPPYNEIAMTIPIQMDPAVNIPVLPMVMSGLFKKFGYYVFGMPVTSQENKIRGNKIWGLPKVTQEIDIFERNGDCVTVAKESDGTPYFQLSVPMQGNPTEFDVTGDLYSALDQKILQSQTCFKGTFQVKKYMNLLFKKGLKPNRPYLEIGNTSSAQILKSLDIEEHPFQFRYARQMNSCFDLPQNEFVQKEGQA